MIKRSSLIALSSAAIACAQQIGNFTAENHPSLTWQKCTKTGGCTTVSGSVVLDANWRWTHKVGSPTNCYTGNKWDTSVCSTNTDCATQCALDGAEYAKTYGITTSGSALTLKFVTQSAQKNVGSRLYLMADNTHYENFKVLNQEFTFDVDASQLPCGLNGAVYFSEMPIDGGISATNKAGAQYGTGYCDSQCPRDVKFIEGKVSV
jgi:cellulose 1,4-beta-cellobiosidase